jgi:hypothetical protein
MGVDKYYGSGKPRSAANSSMRRRVAAGQTPKSVKSIGAKIKVANAKRAASPLGQLADTVFGFALPIGKVKAASMGLRAAGEIGKAAAFEARIAAKTAGKKIGSTFSYWDDAPRTYANARRMTSESVFPRKTPDVPLKKVGPSTYSYTTAGPARIDYLALKKDYQKVFGKNAKVGSFNPDLASMTSYPGRGTAASTLKRLSSRVDKYLANKKAK